MGKRGRLASEAEAFAFPAVAFPPAPSVPCICMAWAPVPLAATTTTAIHKARTSSRSAISSPPPRELAFSADPPATAS